MLVRSLQRATLVSVISVFVFSGSVQAQGSNPRQLRANSVIKTMEARENAESADFNAHLAELNSAGWPFDLKNLDTTRVASSVLRTVGFIEYLKKCRASSDSLQQAFTDSMFVLEAEAPGGKLEKSLRVVRETFISERSAFNEFLESLQNLFTSVLDGLLYLQHEPYIVKGDTFTFINKKATKRYQELMHKIDKAAKEEGVKNEALKKANAEANERLKLQNTAEE